MEGTIKYLDFKDFINLMKSNVDQVRLHINSSRITASAIDNSNVVMVNINLPKESFESYYCNDNITACIYLDKLIPFMNLSYGFVEMIFMSDKVKLSSRNYSMSINYIEDKLVKPDPNSVNIIELTSNITVESIRLKEFLKNAIKINDKVLIEVNNDNETTFMVEYNNNYLTYKIDNGYCAAKTLYSIDYLNDILKYMKGQITMKFSNNHPIQIEGKFATYGTIEYLLAPRE